MDTIFERFGKGRCPVIDFLNGRSIDEEAAIWVSIEMIREFGIDTPRKFLEHLGSGLFLIRARDERVRPRIMAFMFGGYLIATHGLIKKQGPVPNADKTRTTKRMMDWEKIDKRTGVKRGDVYLRELLGG